MIELLVTTVLAAMLMISVLSVIGTVRRATDQLNVEDLHADWRARIVDVITEDIQHAIEWKADEEQFQLITFNKIDPLTMRNTHDIVMVSYLVREKDGQSWLIRTQRPAGIEGEKDTTAIILCDDIVSIECVAIETARDDLKDLADKTTDEQKEREKTPTYRVPDHMELVLRFKSRNSSPIKALIHRNGGRSS